MLRIVFLWCCGLLAAALPAHAAGADTTEHRLSLVHGGQERVFLVHVPTRLPPGRPVPLLVALHGGGGSMDHMAGERRYGLVPAAAERGHILLIPNGVSRMRSGLGATWNAGRCCGSARDAGVDDVGFIRAAVAEVARRWPVDPARVYATGMSNGAMMAYRLACEASDVFSAIAPVAGTDNTVDCKPARPVSVLHIHARDDDHVLFDGGAGPGSVRASLVTDYRSVAETVSRWTTFGQCRAAAPRRVLEVPGAWCERHEPCDGGARVQLCVTETGGHSWPGGQKRRLRGEGPSQAIDANELMWAFFDRR